MAPRRNKNDAPSFSGGDVKSRFGEALRSLKMEDYQLPKVGVLERFVPTGSLVLDEICRLRGLSFKGRVWQIHGMEHGGKSTLTYCFLKSYQQATGEPVVIFDFERTCTYEYLASIGLDVSENMLCLSQPDSVQQACQHMLLFLEAGVKMFVCDSVPRMTNKVSRKDIMSGDAFKLTVGEHAKIVKKFFDTMLPYLAQYDAHLSLVNQHQCRIDSSQEAQMANKYPSMTNHPYVLPGGNAVRFIPCVSLELKLAKAYRAGGADDDFLFEGCGDEDKGQFIINRTKLRVLKNKVTAGGFREANLWIRPGTGIDDLVSVREFARHYDLITPVGRSWRIGTEANPLHVFENKSQALKYLVEEPDLNLLAKLRVEVVAAIRADANGFAAELTEHDKFIAGDDSANPNSGGKPTPFDFSALEDVALA